MGNFKNPMLLYNMKHLERFSFENFRTFSVVLVYPFAVLVCPVVILVFPFVVLTCPFVCPFVISICPLIILALPSADLFLVFYGDFMYTKL